MSTNVMKFSQAIRVGTLASDPASPENGMMYYNSTSGKLRQYVGGSWNDVTAGTISLTGQALPQNNIIVGDSGNLSVDLDTSAVGDILVNSSTGATIKSAAVTDSKVATGISAAKIGAGSVDNTEFGYLDGVTSSIQTQLNAKASTALSNLTTTSINQALLPDSDLGRNLGSAALRWSSLYVNLLKDASSVNALGIGGANDRKLLDTSGVVALNWSTRELYNSSAASMLDWSGSTIDAKAHRISNAADPTSDQDLVTLAYMNARLLGLTPKRGAYVATTANITLSGEQTIDGFLTSASRVLVKDQPAPAQNGVYVSGSGAWTRATDFDSLSPIDEINGAWLPVYNGTISKGRIYVQYGTVAVLDTDPINFEFYNPIADLIGGDMITVSGSTISVDLATNSGLESTNPGNASGQLQIKTDTTTANVIGVSKSANGAGIKISSTFFTDAGSETLSLAAGGITNTEINASAAIALTKLAALSSHNRALQSDGSGFITESSVTSTELGYLSGVTSAIQTQLNAKASTALDNLASTAVNADIIPVSDNSKVLGGATFNWAATHSRDVRSNTTLALKANGGSSNLDITAAKVRKSADGTNFYEVQYVDSQTLTANTTAVASTLTFAHASFEACEVIYKLKQATSNAVRVGRLRVTTNGTNTSLTDDFTETADCQIAWSAAINGANLELSYTNDHATNNSTMRAEVKRIRA